jgi:hypothetical protein
VTPLDLGVEGADPKGDPVPATEASAGASPKKSECPACKARGKTWKGSNPKCAFPDGGAFSPDNWNCATANALRNYAQERAHAQRWSDSSIGYIPLERYDAEGEFLVLHWYKDRGQCEGAYILHGENTPRALTLTEANEILGIEAKPGEQSEPEQSPVTPTLPLGGSQ